ncbi:lipase family protein [Actinocorallia sp. B10E7]|uniref:lipase family protein n=1 Tax=Actinocorallia sp. B10E7 TaxID=3153558 RepID=UPI00325C663E
MEAYLRSAGIAASSQRIYRISPLSTGTHVRGLDAVSVLWGFAPKLPKDWCAKGADVTWQVYPIAEHVLGTIFAEPASVMFLDDRFNGKAVKGDG